MRGEMVQAVKAQRLSQQIAKQIKELIRQGPFSSDQRLPAERDLAKLFGVKGSWKTCGPTREWRKTNRSWTSKGRRIVINGKESVTMGVEANTDYRVHG